MLLQEWVFELSNGQFLAAAIEHNPPGHDGMMTGLLSAEEVWGSKFYPRVPAQANSTPAMVFSQLLEVAKRRCVQAGEGVCIVAVNNPAGVKLVSVDEQQSQLGDGVTVTVKDGPMA
jgi:hypothetical protein